MKKVGFYTLGCKVNQYETQAMIEMFKREGYETVDFEESADVYVINTCTVTSFSDKKSRQVIHRAQRSNPEAIIAVVGCYSQISPEEIGEIKGVDVIVGTAGRSQIVELIKAAKKGRKIKSVDDIMNQRNFQETGIISYSEKTRAFIKIQEGCDNFCSYCIIPYARGPVRSRHMENILKEVHTLAGNGFQEIVLTGIHLTSYGKDIKNTALLEIIEEINKIPEIKRIRLGSLEPNFITDEFVLRAKRIKKLCPHFHISLQSGSDAVLKRMNRKYNTTDYKNKIMLLRENIKDVSITTDVMVGFPGESEEEFKETYDFLDDLSLSRMHIFKYSKRKGTPAASYPEQIDAETKDKRSSILLRLSQEKERVFQSKFSGRIMEVLFEQESGFDSKYLQGHTDNFIQTAAKADKSSIGKIEQVKLSEVKNGLIIGEWIKN